ncbi:MAG: 7-carboxy-7-deazaguanine synthase QueE [Gammaproteobacteria bacterium]|nr:7-carboxy-7-deazaguanine synthase QueE [Gammaproteobacteria bacterium]
MTYSQKLRITEIFHSLQGESRTAGLPTVFIRLTGCPLRCQYCDTAYAFQGGKLISIAEIIASVKAYECLYVTVTGGEPLAQPLCIDLLKVLCDSNFIVSLETSGAFMVDEIDKRVSVVLDLKTPGSSECAKNKYENLSHLNKKDQVKFVICDRNDYEWSKAKIKQYDLGNKVGEVLLSPSYDQLKGSELANWVPEDGLSVRVQLQLHKLLWGLEPGR